jgi:hypothetical protein
VDDLEQLAVQHTSTGVSPAQLEQSLRALKAVHARYGVAYVLDDERRVLAVVDGEPQLQLLADDLSQPGMEDASEVVGAAVAPQHAPLGTGAVVAHYDVSFLGTAAEAAAPGEVWVLNGRGDVIWSSTDADLFQQIEDDELAEAARRGAAGRTGALVSGVHVGEQVAVGHAPISGPGPGGELGWSLVTSRSAVSMPSPALDARRVGYSAAMAIALVTVLVFGWLHAVGVSRRRPQR